jgi:hypothetical protein
MKDLTRMAVLAASLLLPGCADQSAITEPLAPKSVVAGNSGCHTVKFAAFLTPIDGLHYTGQLSGDLVGTADVLFDEIGPFTGATLHVAANAAWTITGGHVPELIGETFLTRMENRNIFLPGTALAKNVGSLRVISGVEKANLTYTGQTSLITGEVHLDFNGVICPE